MILTKNRANSPCSSQLFRQKKHFTGFGFFIGSFLPQFYVPKAVKQTKSKKQPVETGTNGHAPEFAAKNGINPGLPSAKRPISVRGARVHNLKNVSLDLQRNKLHVFTGVSGSGKSSLAFDTLYAEGQRRYVESLSVYARQFLERMTKPDVDSITGISPAVAIEQKTLTRNPRSTVGTTTEIYDYLRLLFARVGHTYCVCWQRAVSAKRYTAYYYRCYCRARVQWTEVLHSVPNAPA